ncbi:hypothetical protein GCK72_013346 [Caenorhabditis remanei]|uniref:Potassium channel domain-containing protein n=1 Tax=Caenorhabditis remanei TaxID=31234 RepID=A0A6A5GR91_CAERE|nr:hypothetical protein GCK72_013346 [Caenorhabditis remanei]KAF1756892.1 hypothetical protein GCK72_013346 [Caenorhabditis remanei]
MPVLLRAVGFGRSSNNNRNLRPNSGASGDRLRRPSQISAGAQSSATRHSNPDRDKVVQSRIHETEGEEKEKETWGQRFHRAYKEYHIKYLFPLIFIMFYMLIGALIFYFLESGAAEEVASEEDYKYKRERRLLLLRMEELIQEPASKRRVYRKKALEEAIDNYEQKLDFSVKNESQWTFMSAMYFAGTLFTTIGYGDIACTTSAGRIATVIYSCVGIPFMLITLNDLGKFLYNNINGCVKGFEDFTTYLGAFRLCRRGNGNFPKGDDLVNVEAGTANPDIHIEVSSVASELGSERNESDYEDIEDEEERAMPRMSVKVALGITVGWIFFCSGLFKLWEDWTYGESCYFMFISLSTIGLGDVSVQRRDMMVLCFVFVIVGLSLVSMTINVIQVALEDFYVNLIMKLILDYQEKMAAGGDQMGASVGMMRMWGNNKTAKFLMPLLSKEKKKMAMEKVEVKAKNNGFEIPAILTDLDEKSGMPKLFHIEEQAEGEEPPKILEELVQKQIDIEEAAAENAVLFVAHDANTQTDILLQEEKGHQTDEKQYGEGGTQTEVLQADNLECETQTEMILNSIAETQTVILDYTDSDTMTQPVIVNESDSQTEYVQTKEEELQTYIDTNDMETLTEIETKNVRIQTPQPVIEQKCVQTEDLQEDRKSPSKMSSAKKRLRRAFAGKSKPSRSSLEHPVMSDWKDVEESETAVDEEEEEIGSVESLHWDPVDGMHAEKQLPVKKLKAMFDSPKGQRKLE